MYRRREKRGQETGYPRGQELGETGNEFCNIVQYFAIGKAHRGGDHQGRGREPGVQGAGSGKFRPPLSPLLSLSTKTSSQNFPCCYIRQEVVVLAGYLLAPR